MEPHFSKALMIVLTLLVAVGLGGYVVFRRQTEARSGRLVCPEPHARWQSPALGQDKPDPHAVEVADATFELLNVGDRPVHVLSTESSCGCSTPRVEPTEIPPAGSCRVFIEATPFFVGEKTVLITLNTDSSTTPRVDLRLTMIGGRKPPFLLRTPDHLRIDLGPGDESNVQTFEVITVQSKDEIALPRISCGTESIAITLKDTKIRPHLISDYIYKTYIYNISYIDAISNPYLSESITIRDPWDSAYSRTTPVLIAKVPAIQSVPARVLHSVRSSDDVHKESDFLIIRRDKRSSSELVAIGGEDLSVIAVPGTSSEKSFFRLRLKKPLLGEGLPKMSEVRFMESSTGKQLLVVPVNIRVENAL